MFKREGTNFNRFSINTEKTIRRNYLRQLAKERYQQLHASSPDVRPSDSTHNRTNNEQGPLSDGSENQIKLDEFYANLKNEAQRCEKKLSEMMVFATKSGTEVKEVLSEYGEQLRRDRKIREMQEYPNIILKHLKEMQGNLDKSLSNKYSETDSSPSTSSTTSDSSTEPSLGASALKKSNSTDDELIKMAENLYSQLDASASKKSNSTDDELIKMAKMAENLYSQLKNKNGKTTQETATYQEIRKGLAARKSDKSELKRFLTNVENLYSQLNNSKNIALAAATYQETLEQIKGLTAKNKLTYAQKYIINVWE